MNRHKKETGYSPGLYLFGPTKRATHAAILTLLKDARRVEGTRYPAIREALYASCRYLRRHQD